MSKSIVFKGKSGEPYYFQALPLGAKFKAMAGVYIVTRRTCEDRTFATKASHTPLAIGQTADFASAFLSKAELSRLVEKGANSICLFAVADAARRSEIERDLVEGNERLGGALRYLFHDPVPQQEPGQAAPAATLATPDP